MVMVHTIPYIIPLNPEPSNLNPYVAPIYPLYNPMLHDAGLEKKAGKILTTDPQYNLKISEEGLAGFGEQA